MSDLPADNELEADDFTAEEMKAIKSLQRLGNRWPQTLRLFSYSGSLVVFHTADTLLGDDADWHNMPQVTIFGIPNEGGDPG